MEDSQKNVIMLAMIGVIIGIAGIVAFHQSLLWLLYACAVICLVQWLLNLLAKQLRPTTIPYLAACCLAGYYISGTYIDGVCYGVCLYYATVFLYSVIPMQLALIVVPIASIIGYFTNVEQLFIITAVFCTVNFIITHFRGKNPHFAMGIFIACAVIGTILVFSKGTDEYTSIKIVKGLLWGGAAYYIAGVFYAYLWMRKGNGS